MLRKSTVMNRTALNLLQCGSDKNDSESELRLVYKLLDLIYMQRSFKIKEKIL